MKKLLAITGLILLVCSNSVYPQNPFLRNFELGTGDTGPVPPSNSVSHIAVQDSVLWIGSSKGLARTRTGGRSWESFRSHPAFVRDGIFAVATRNDTIWAAMGFVKTVTDQRIQTGAGYAYSIDNGSMWTHIPQTLDDRGDSLIVYGLDTLKILPIVVPEQNVTFDLSLSPGKVWITSWASGLRYSTNSGVTWNRVILPPADRLAPRTSPSDPPHTFMIDPRQNNNFLAFSVLAIDNDTVWCGTAGGVNKSTDGGVSWVRFTRRNQQAPILGNWVIAIKEQRFQNTRRIWTTNWRAEDPIEEFGVSYTDDGGRTWTNLLHGIRAYEFEFKDSIAYIATEQGVYRTDDGGQSFVRSGSIIDTETRERITTSSVFAVGVIEDTVWLATSDGMVSTIDNAMHPFGTRWKIHRRFDPVGASRTTYAYPNPFSPNFEITRIHYSTHGTDTEVSIDIFDFAMNPMRTIIRDAFRIGAREHDEVWNGRDDNGRIAANGVYFYRVQVRGEEPIWGKIMVLR